MTKKHFIILISLLIATTLGSIFIVFANAAYFFWYKEEVIWGQEFLADRKRGDENVLKKYPEEEITTEIISQMLKRENQKNLSDIFVLLSTGKKISGILTDDTTYSVTDPAGEKNVNEILGFAKNQIPIDLQGKPHFLNNTTRNILDTKINTFIEAKTILGRLDGYKKYNDYYLSGSEEDGYNYYSPTLLVITNILYLLLFGFTAYWVRKYYRLTGKSKITARA